MVENDRLISAADAAKRLNISKAMLSRLVSSGRLGVYRIGHRTLFDEQIINEFKTAVFQPSRRAASASSA